MAKIFKKTKLGQGVFVWAEGAHVDTDFIEIIGINWKPRQNIIIAEIGYYQKKASITGGISPTLTKIFEFDKNNDNNIENFVINQLTNADTLKEWGTGNVITNFHKGAAEETTPAPAPAPKTK